MKAKHLIILRYNRVPGSFINVIRKIYEGNASWNYRCWESKICFKFRVGVNRGCVMSGVLLIVNTDCVRKNISTKIKEMGGDLQDHL